MSFRDCKIAFELFLKNHWTSTAIKYQDVPFDEQKDVDGNPKSYIALSIRETQDVGGSEITLGSDNPWYRWVGTAVIEIYVPEKKFPGVPWEYADQLKGIFKQVVSIVNATDISVTASDNSIHSTITDFITRGVVVGMTLRISGFTHASNNGIFTVSHVTQRSVRFAGSGLGFVNETAGSVIQISGRKILSYRNSGFIHTRVGYAINVGVNNGWQQVNLHIPYYRDSQS